MLSLSLLGLDSYQARLKPSTPTFDPTQPTRPGDLPGRQGDLYAIKKFKPDKEGEVVTYTGISQSALREIAVSSWMSYEGCDGEERGS